MVGAVAAQLALARVVDEELRDLAERAAFLAAVDDEPDAAGLRAADALFDRVRQIRPARADVGAEHVGAVAFVVHARGQRDVGIREIARVAEHVDRLPADRRQEHLEVAARDELRIHAARFLEQRATQIGLAHLEPPRNAGQPPHRLDRRLGDDGRTVRQQELAVGREPTGGDRLADLGQVDVRLRDGDRRPDVVAVCAETSRRRQRRPRPTDRSTRCVGDRTTADTARSDRSATCSSGRAGGRASATSAATASAR